MRFGIVIVSTLFLLSCGQLRPQPEVLSAQSETDYKNAIDASVRPRLLESENLILYRSKGVTQIETSPIYGDEFSLVLLVPSDASGDLVVINSGPAQDEIKLTLSSGTLTISRTSSDGNSSMASLSLPVSPADNILGFRFGSEATDYDALLNGQKVDLEKVSTGTPEDFRYLLKDVSFSPASGTLSDIFFFNVDLQNYEINSLSRLIDENKNLNQTVFDISLVPGIGVPKEVPTAEFLAAKAVLDNSCIGCHNGGVAPSFVDLNQAQFLDRSTSDGGKLVVKQSLESSALYYRLSTTSGVGPGPHNMSISQSDTAVIATWINSIP